MTFKIGDLVELDAKEFKNLPAVAAFEGRVAKIVSTIGAHKSRINGRSMIIFGYQVVFLDNNLVAVIKEGFLKKVEPSRSDMDRIITWDYVYQTTGWRPRDGE